MYSKKIKIQDCRISTKLIEEKSNIENFFIIYTPPQNLRSLLFISQDFLDLFNLPQSVKINGDTLSSKWGGCQVKICRNGEYSLSTSNTLEKARVMQFDTVETDDIISELFSAKKFISTVTFNIKTPANIFENELKEKKHEN